MNNKTPQSLHDKSLYDKLWQSHVVCELGEGIDMLYIDRQLIHEVTSPQAFDGITLANRELWHKKSILAVPDHNVPTTNRDEVNPDAISRLQLETLEKNAISNKLAYIPLNDIRQGIVHVIGPEQGFIQPGITIVCGDSHTATHGAFAALGFGIGTSQVEQVFATQCLPLKKSKNFLVNFTGALPEHVEAKDMILALIRRIGTSGATGYTLEYQGQAITNLNMEERMTICNMSIEAGARSGLIAVDDTTINYLSQNPILNKNPNFDRMCDFWLNFYSDKNAHFEQRVDIDVSTLQPQISWGTSPEMVVSLDEKIPNPQSFPNKEDGYQSALTYMGLQAGQDLASIEFDTVFIGSCTNSRISDLRRAADVILKSGKKVHKRIKRALVVPGSMLVRQEAEKEGIDKVFINAGFEWRHAGCSMCLGMNADTLSPEERCASTSNRNFEGRQGKGGRTHLMSPTMATATALTGRVTNPQDLTA